MKIETLSHTLAHGWSAPASAIHHLDSPNTLVLAFGDAELFDGSGPLTELVAQFPTSKVVSCSAAGAIVGSKVVDDTLAVAVVRFDKTTLRTSMRPVSDGVDARAAGREIGHELNGPKLKGVVILSDGLLVNGSELAAGLNEVLPEGIVVTGGLAGDDDRFERTWVLHNGQPLQSIVAAVAFYGDDVVMTYGSRGGWDIFGRERVVTRSDGNMVYELDGQPALQLYKTYLGDFASGLPSTGLRFPLALLSEVIDGEPIVRTLLGIDEAEQSLRFAGNVPQGAQVRLMRTNLDRLVDGAADAAERAIVKCEDVTPTLSIAISCVGRRLVLGERSDEELESVMELLPPGTEQIGFYSYGELSPLANGRCDLHNQTMTLTTISER